MTLSDMRMNFYPYTVITLNPAVFLPFGNLKIHNLGIFQSLELRNLMGKFLQISLKLNFTPNTLSCFGLKWEVTLTHGTQP